MTDAIKGLPLIVALIAVSMVMIGIAATITGDLTDNANLRVKETLSATDTDLNLNSTTDIQLTYTNLSTSTITMVNVTDNVAITAANYTVSTVTGIVNASSVSVNYNGTTVNITYSYNTFDYLPRSIAKNGSEGLAEVGSNSSTLAVVAMLTVILGILGGLWIYYKK